MQEPEINWTTVDIPAWELNDNPFPIDIDEVGFQDVRSDVLNVF